MSKLSELVTGEQIATWLIIAFLVFYFLYKEFPELKKRISASALKDQMNEGFDKTISQRLDSIETDIREIKSKLESDYDRLTKVEERQSKSERVQQASLKEGEIMMRALSSILGALDELGVGDKTVQSEAEIGDYLNHRAHELENEL